MDLANYMDSFLASYFSHYPEYLTTNLRMFVLGIFNLHQMTSHVPYPTPLIDPSEFALDG